MISVKAHLGRRRGTVAIYRIEFGNGTGVYQSQCGSHIIVSILSNNPTNTQPMPYEDGLPLIDCDDMYEHHHFGFACHSDLRRWFPGDVRHELGKAGLKLAVYVAPRDAVRHGGHQVTFDHTQARRVRQEVLA